VIKNAHQHALQAVDVVQVRKETTSDFGAIKIILNDIQCIDIYYIIISQNNIGRWILSNLDNIFQSYFNAIDNSRSAKSILFEQAI